MAAAVQGETVRSLLVEALRDAGIVALGQQASADQIARAQTRLKWILAQWSTKRWFSWRLFEASAMSQGQLYFTVGPSGDINGGSTSDFSPDFSVDFAGQAWRSRPLQVEDAFARQLANNPGGQIDYGLRRLASREDYSRIQLKTLNSFPTHWYYDPDLPLGKLYFWPIPQAGVYEMHVLVRQPLAVVEELDAELPFPEEYAPALELTLAEWLRMSYKMPPDPGLAGLARGARNALKVNNTSLPSMQMPTALVSGRGRYNYFTDEV